MPSLKIKKGDRVIVMAGRDKGKRGEVIAVMPKENRARVRGVNILTREDRSRKTVPISAESIRL